MLEKKLNENELKNVTGGRGPDWSMGYEEYTWEKLASVPIGKEITVFDRDFLEDGAVGKAIFQGKKKDAESEYYSAVEGKYEYKRRPDNINQWVFAVLEIID